MPLSTSPTVVGLLLLLWVILMGYGLGRVLLG